MNRLKTELVRQGLHRILVYADNFEAVPEVAYQTEVDPFLTVSLFKRAACLVPDAAKAVSETWRARNFGIDPFLFYANGKTSVRCGVGACPVSVQRRCGKKSLP